MKFEKQEPTIVTIPVDITELEAKLFFHLSLRQILCIIVGLVLGLPAYFLMQKYTGNNSASVFAMMAIMLPAFMMAIYRKNGKTLDQQIKTMITFYVSQSKNRPYRTDNAYKRKEVMRIARISQKSKSPKSKS